MLETDAKDVASYRAKRSRPDNWRASGNIQYDIRLNVNTVLHNMDGSLMSLKNQLLF